MVRESPHIPVDAARALLVAAGYQVAFVANGWTQCDVSRNRERWAGHGDSEHDAFEHALAQMLPSVLARELFTHGVAEPASAEAQAPKHENAPTPVRETSVAAAMDAPRSSATAGARGHSDAISPPRVGASPPSATRDAIVAALEVIEDVLVEVEQELGRFARLAPERQRLELLAWICRARAVEEAFAGERDVSLAVARVARRLTELAKTFWPGSVLALQLTTTPADTMEARTGHVPYTWVDAGASARQRIDAERARGAAAGLDDDGWSDALFLKPAAPDPDDLLMRAIAELAERLESPRTSRSRAQDHADVDSLLTVARTLRWIRTRASDPVAWGTAVGRLRRHASTLDETAARRLREVLDPRTRPAGPWSRLVTGPERAPKLSESETSSAPSDAELRAALPEATRSAEALLAWLILAFDVLSTPELCELLAPAREQLLAVGELAANHEDRRIRRRLRELLVRLDDAPESAAATPEVLPAAPVSDQDDDEPVPSAGALEALLERVRAITAGRRVLFVSNRLDPELEARLTDLLDIQLTACEGSLRRVQAQCTRISKGSYDLVLSATGFQFHGVDGALSRAAGLAKIPYVRVDRGRPLTCVRALARDFGLLDA